MEKLKKLASKFNKEEFVTLTEEITFESYLEKVYENPLIIRTAYQRLYDMVMADGTEEVYKFKKKLTHYKFFDDKEIPIFGLEETLDAIVKFFKGAAGCHGTEKRILLLHGPVGSSKSTILRRLKRGLEDYSRKPEGAWYSFKWVDLPTGADGIYITDKHDCPIHEEPLKLIPLAMRKKVIDELNEFLMDKYPSSYKLICEGDLDPFCRKMMKELMDIYKGDWLTVVNKHVRVIRKVHSESDRCGIATFQPKDEKNQDSTELTGDIDFRNIGHFGSDSNPFSFSFDGELLCANRGLIEFIEIFKLATEFLYDLLGASQEKQVKPKKFAQIMVDEAILGHSNCPDWDRIKGNAFLEALKDRTVKIDVPYGTEWSNEIKVLNQDYGPDKIKTHIAPHTIEIAALWLVLTRLKEDEKLTLVQKARLYNGDSLPNYTEDTVKELKEKYTTEGMQGGMSVRYVQDKFSDCLSNNHSYVNFFMVLHAIEDGLKDCALITKKEDLAHYVHCVKCAVAELDEILKDEVRKALVGDEKAIERLCANYIEQIMAYIRKSKVKNKFTGNDEKPNERLMRSIEEQIGIPDTNADDFRRMIAAYIGDLATDNKKFRWDSNPDLKRALEAKLFEDVKNTIKLSSLNMAETSVVAPDTQEKIDEIKRRMILWFNYSEESASDTLAYCGSLFARTAVAGD